MDSPSWRTIACILNALHELVDTNEDTDFVKQIHLIETFKGAGFLSAVSLMGEIGDFSVFSKPKQLFAYFGLDPVLRDCYLKKCESKPKLVAIGAVSHKVCNIIFAILRDNKPFEIITPQEHIKQYNAAKCDIAA